MRYPTREYQTDKPSRKVSLFIPPFYFRLFQKNKEKMGSVLDREAHHIRCNINRKRLIFMEYEICNINESKETIKQAAELLYITFSEIMEIYG